MARLKSCPSTINSFHNRFLPQSIPSTINFSTINSFHNQFLHDRFLPQSISPRSILSTVNCSTINSFHHKFLPRNALLRLVETEAIPGWMVSAVDSVLCGEEASNRGWGVLG